MAFSGVNIAYGKINLVGQWSDVFGKTYWSETMTIPGSTSKAATEPKSRVNYAFLVQAHSDIYVSTGPNPNATNGPRIRVYAGTERVIPAEQGDKLAWVAA